MKFLLGILISMSAFSSAWVESNSPYKLNKSYEAIFEKQAMTGKLKDPKLAWPGNHWANFIGGIAHRWSAGVPQNFSYKFYSLEELKKLAPHELRELSPAEKFDIYRGDYSYSTVKKVWSETSPRESEWHGICHGYAPAALHHPEPARVKRLNPDGLELTFYSSDVAGLLSYYYAKLAQSKVKPIGTRCRYGTNEAIPAQRQSACADLNAGSWHIVLTNQLGAKGESFVADIDRFREVWNHLPVSYTARERGHFSPLPTSAKGTAKRIQMETIVSYAAAIAPKFDPVLGTENALYAAQTYEYYLDIDKKGKVIGGDWISANRPDFIWTQGPSEFVGVWAALDQIYEESALSEL